MSRKDKGKANPISGFPLPGSMSQEEGSSVEPNRDEPKKTLEHQDDGERYARDYFDDEEERLGDLSQPFVANKDDEEWSVGIADEANPDIEQGSDSEIFPETEPLFVIPDSGDSERDEAGNIILRPSTIEQETDYFTDIEDDQDMEDKDQK